MSRRYPTAELYEERQRDFYGRNGNRSDRNYDELDIELNHSHGPRRSAPPDNFLRDDYNRPAAGPLVVRERREEETSRGPPRRREVEEDTLVIRGGRPSAPPPPSSVGTRAAERDDITIRRSEAAPRRPREVDTEETDILIRHQHVDPPRSRGAEPREREFEREDILFRRGDGAPPRPRPREVDIEREEVRFRERDAPPPRREVERDDFVYRHEERREDSRHGRDREVEKDSLVIRNRERSLPPPRARGELYAREREEFVVRRREPSPPPREREVIKDEIIVRRRDATPPPREREIIKDEIIIRRREERSPTPPPPPPPPPMPEPEIRPPIIQEIITHHRHIDHGVERARSPTPPPPPPSPPREENIEISIRRNHFTAPVESDFDLEIDYYSRKRETAKPKPKDMWTEITKDLVLKEAVDSCGYEYEETDLFFYVMEYLRYEDVLRLVEISDEIRNKRKSRIRQIEYEREEIRDRRPPGGYDERYYEHEVSFGGNKQRYR
ncbi:hypothetical protein BDV95DRAFT_631189 [Massariosphaeria phaeospora]|uniref:DUF8035 domain-containing protein n=1 Tax=Massariosphaeria phaeospora TaxID=100035 RepID=A0A7C8M4Q1_9PLEO|nr:hypothetical protein BDV95DRAFT_631189 [Massariosphaeria phaeospora]